MEYGSKQVVKRSVNRNQKTEDRMNLKEHRMKVKRQKMEDGVKLKMIIDYSQSLSAVTNVI